MKLKIAWYLINLKFFFCIKLWKPQRDNVLSMQYFGDILIFFTAEVLGFVSLLCCNFYLHRLLCLSFSVVFLYHLNLSLLLLFIYALCSYSCCL